MSAALPRDRILTAPLGQLFYALTPPSILGLLVLAVNYFVDAVFIGRFLGRTALAGVSFAFPLVFLPGAFGAMVGAGAGVYVSVAMGANDVASQRRLWGNVVCLLLLGALGSTLLLSILAVPLVALMGARGELLPIAAGYYRVTALGAATTTFASGLFSLIQGEGKVKEASVLAVSSAVVNLALNPLFLGVFHWGVAGAALATVISLGLWSVLNVLHFTRGHASFAIDLRYYGLDAPIVKRVLSLGFPQLLLRLLNLTQQLVVLRALARYGTTWDVAFYGAVSRLWQLLVVPMSGIGMAFQPVVGMNFGAGLVQRVRAGFHFFSIAGGAVATLLWLPIFVNPSATIQIVLPASVLSAQDVVSFRMLLLLVPFYPLFFNAISLLQAVGNTGQAGLLAVGRAALFFIPALWILTRSFGTAGVYYAAAGTDLLVVGLALAFSTQALAKMARA